MLKRISFFKREEFTLTDSSTSAHPIYLSRTFEYIQASSLESPEWDIHTFPGVEESIHVGWGV
jgi:hypothetical protein